MSTPEVYQRAFLALSPDAHTREWLAAKPLALGARQVHSADLHLTLAFLGSITHAQRLELSACLPSWAGPMPPLAFGGIEYWPTPARARVMVASFDLPDALHALVLNVRSKVSAMRLPVEDRRFRPHVTLARSGRAGMKVETPPERGARSRGVANDAGGLTGTTRLAGFDAVALYARLQDGEGPRYIVLQKVLLAD